MKQSFHVMATPQVRNSAIASLTALLLLSTSGLAMAQSVTITGVNLNAAALTPATASSTGIALGNSAAATATQSIAIGNNASVTTDNSVAIGNGAVAGAAHTDINNVISSVAGSGLINNGNTAATSVFAVGGNGQYRQIQGVADGRVSSTSTDAINGSQLYNAYQGINTAYNAAQNAGAGLSNVANALGGGASYNAATNTFVAPTYTVQGSTYNNVGGAVTALNTGVTNAQSTANTALSSATTANTNLTALGNSTASALQGGSSYTAGSGVSTPVYNLGVNGTQTGVGNAIGAVNTAAINAHNLANNVGSTTATALGVSYNGTTGAVGTPTFTGTAAGQTTFQGAVNAVSNQTSTNTSNISTLNGQMATANGNISTLNSQMITANGNISTLQGQMGTANSNISTLQTQMSSAGTALNSLTTTVNDHTTSISNLNNGLAQTNANVTTAQNTANTALTNAATAQGTANQALALGQNSVQYTVDGSGTKTGVTLNPGGAPLQISNVAAATSGNQAVNLSQMNSAITDGTKGGVKYDSDGNGGHYNQITLGGAPGQTAGPVKITNVKEGDISSAGSSDAVTGGQLYTTNQNVTNLSSTVNNINNGAGIKYFHTNSVQADSAALGTDSTAIGPSARVETGAANGVAMGNGAITTGSFGVAIGGSAEAGVDSAAIGGGAKATGNNGNAFGRNANAAAVNSVSVGGGSAVDATANDGLALGFNSRVGAGASQGVAIGSGASVAAGAANSAAIGANSVATRNNEVSMGRAESAPGAGDAITRTVTNVAGGRVAVDSTDAINGSQLFAAIAGSPGLNGIAYTDTTKTTVILGNPGQGVLMSNLAAGQIASGSTDAVTGGQLYDVQNRLDKRIDSVAGYAKKIGRNAYGGIAAVAAFQPLQMPDAGKMVWAAGIGGYRGQVGVAGQLGYRFSNTRTMATAGIGASTADFKSPVWRVGLQGEF